MTIRALAKVGDAYKLDKQVQRTFYPLANLDCATGAYLEQILGM